MRGWDSVAQFTDQLFGHLHRVDQRRWAHAYVQGLLSTSGKKTIRRLATASDSPTAAHALHQFVNESPWEWAPVCEQLRQWAEERARPRAWTVVPVVLPKRGEKSCGVHRRFIPHNGRTVNCQVGIAVFMSTGAGEFPVGWSLFLPEPWSRGPRREGARVPRSVASSAEGQTLHLIDSLVQSRPDCAPLVVNLDGYMDADAGLLIRGLHRRQRDFVIAVPEGLPLAAYSRSRPRPALTAGRIIRDEHGDTAPDGRTAPAPTPTRLVRLPGAATADQHPEPLRLYAQTDPYATGRGRLWITNMVDRPVEELLDHADRHATAGDTVSLLERGFGLRDFEGRSYPGWHHHMTLVSAAFTYSRLSAPAHGGPARLNSRYLSAEFAGPPARFPLSAVAP